MTQILIFISSLALTLFLGLQSKNVNQSKYFAAGITSIMISLCNIVTVKVAVSENILSIILMIFGSAIGIMLSIYLHDRFIK